MFYVVVFEHGFCITDDTRRVLGIIQQTWWIEVRCFAAKAEAYLWGCRTYAKRYLETLPVGAMPVIPMPSLEAFDVADTYLCPLCPYTIRPTRRYFGLIAPKEASIILENIDELAGIFMDVREVPILLKEFETEQAVKGWIAFNVKLPLFALGAYIPQVVSICLPDVGERVTTYSGDINQETFQKIAANLHIREVSYAANEQPAQLLQSRLLPNEKGGA